MSGEFIEVDLSEAGVTWAEALDPADDERAAAALRRYVVEVDESTDEEAPHRVPEVRWHEATDRVLLRSEREHAGLVRFAWPAANPGQVVDLDGRPAGEAVLDTGWPWSGEDGVTLVLDSGEVPAAVVLLRLLDDYERVVVGDLSAVLRLLRRGREDEWDDEYATFVVANAPGASGHRAVRALRRDGFRAAPLDWTGVLPEVDRRWSLLDAVAALADLGSGSPHTKAFREALDAAYEVAHDRAPLPDLAARLSDEDREAITAAAWSATLADAVEEAGGTALLGGLLRLAPAGAAPSLSLLVGAPRAGKTPFLVQACLDALAGRDALGAFAPAPDLARGRVVYVSCEDDVPRLTQHPAYRAAAERGGADAVARFHLVTPYHRRSPHDPHEPLARGRLAAPDYARAFGRGLLRGPALDHERPDLLVVDSAASLLSGSPVADLDSGRNASVLWDAVEAMADGLGARAVVLVAHSTKAHGEDASGSTQLVARARDSVLTYTDGSGRGQTSSARPRTLKVSRAYEGAWRVTQDADLLLHAVPLDGPRGAETGAEGRQQVGIEHVCAVLARLSRFRPDDSWSEDGRAASVTALREAVQAAGGSEVVPAAVTKRAAADLVGEALAVGLVEEADPVEGRRGAPSPSLVLTAAGRAAAASVLDADEAA